MTQAEAVALGFMVIVVVALYRIDRSVEAIRRHFTERDDEDDPDSP